MHTAPVLALLVSLMSSGGLSMTIRAFNGDKCTGGSSVINIPEDRCRATDGAAAIRSFRVLNRGKDGQQATFYAGASCFGEQRSVSKASLSSSGACITLNFKAISVAATEVERD